MEKTYNDILLTAIGNNFPHYTKLIVVIRNSEGKVISFNYYVNLRLQHAEVIMLSNFKSDDKLPIDLSSITLTINYSPCSDCAKELISFYKENESRIRSFTIRCSNLYKQNVEENKNGLKSLIKAGIHLRAMDEYSWKELALSINVDLKNSDKYDKYKERVKKRDDETRAALQALLDEINKEALTARLASLSLNQGTFR